MDSENSQDFKMLSQKTEEANQFFLHMGARVQQLNQEIDTLIRRFESETGAVVTGVKRYEWHHYELVHRSDNVQKTSKMPAGFHVMWNHPKLLAEVAGFSGGNKT